jgi:hypothetical protein
MLELQFSTPANAPAGNWTVKQKAQIFAESFEPGRTYPRSLDDTENRNASLHIATKLGGVPFKSVCHAFDIAVGPWKARDEENPGPPPCTPAFRLLTAACAFEARAPHREPQAAVPAVSEERLGARRRGGRKPALGTRAPWHTRLPRRSGARPAAHRAR